MNNIFLIILDSCRYDSFIKARTPNFDRIAKVQKRYSYASWTSPSHFTFLMGLLPHSSQKNIFASTVYESEYRLWQKRIGIDTDIKFENLLPEFNLIKFLNGLGYRTFARVSLPVLNPQTTLSYYFYDYRLMDNHNSFSQIVESIVFYNDIPTFYLLNLGETHYPYMLDDPELPHLSGLNGVLRKIDSSSENSLNGSYLKPAVLKKLQKQQIKAVSYCDAVFGELIEKCPSNTYFIVTSDHGELFGENGYFGHGPIMHEKVFEVPMIEGKISK